MDDPGVAFKEVLPHRSSTLAEHEELVIDIDLTVDAIFTSLGRLKKQ
jgi:hypothetical protein